MPWVSTCKPTLLTKFTIHSITQIFTRYYHMPAVGFLILTVCPLTLTLPLWASVPSLKAQKSFM